MSVNQSENNLYKYIFLIKAGCRLTFVTPMQNTKRGFFDILHWRLFSYKTHFSVDKTKKTRSQLIKVNIIKTHLHLQITKSDQKQSDLQNNENMYQESKNSAKAFRTILDISEVSFVLKVLIFLLKSPNTSYVDGTIVFCIYLLRTLPNHPTCLFLADIGALMRLNGFSFILVGRGLHVCCWDQLREFVSPNVDQPTLNSWLAVSGPCQRFKMKLVVFTSKIVKVADVQFVYIYLSCVI